MSETNNVQEITNEDVELAIRVLIEWHKKRNLAFAVVNSAVGIVTYGGNAFELEGALNHAHRIIEFENGSRLMEIRNMQKGIEAARKESFDGPN